MSYFCYVCERVTSEPHIGHKNQLSLELNDKRNKPEVIRYLRVKSRLFRFHNCIDGVERL